MSVIPFVRRQKSGEVPKPLAQKLSGSVQGADELAVQAAAVAANPSRLLVRQRCMRCAYTWQAPAAGRCPQCYNSATLKLGAVPCMAARI